MRYKKVTSSFVSSILFNPLLAASIALIAIKSTWSDIKHWSSHLSIREWFGATVALKKFYFDDQSRLALENELRLMLNFRHPR